MAFTDKFIRYGTAEESSDKESPERYVQLKVNFESEGLPKITLKRPPLVLIHGIWGSKDTFKGLMLLTSWGGNKRYDPVYVDYEKTNADAVSLNSGPVWTKINDKDKSLIKAGILPGKYDVVVHSMGGLLLRDLCAKNLGFCESKFRKIVTVDTPHKGSKLANMIIDVSKNARDSECFKEVLLAVHNKKKPDGTRAMTVWGDSDNRIVKDAVRDLSEGSEILETLPQLPKEWSAVIGIADANEYGHDPDIGLLTLGIKLYCKKDNSELLTVKNDRIVSYDSQKGAATNYHEINAVDHSSVVNVSTLKDILISILEKGGR